MVEKTVARTSLGVVKISLGVMKTSLGVVKTSLGKACMRIRVLNKPRRFGQDQALAWSWCRLSCLVLTKTDQDKRPRS